MKQIRYTISPRIFAQHPGYTRGLVVATGIDNGSCPLALKTLRDSETALAKLMTLESLLSSAKIVSWREAFREMGVNPSNYRPSHEALARRALQGKELPDINTAVNIGNAISLRHQLPVGVHPLDDVKVGFELRHARGDENFTAFGSDQRETPNIGEVIFADGNEVVSRCWVWRQSKNSVTLPASRSIVVNIDGLPPVSEAEILAACTAVKELLDRTCGGEIGQHILSVTNPSIVLTVP